MPVLKHAKKKLRQDKKRTERNRKVKETFRSLIKKAKVTKTVAALGAAFSSIDKAAKHHILEKNKAARMKSSLSKVVEGKGPAAAPKKAVVKKVAGKKVLAKKKSPAKKKK